MRIFLVDISPTQQCFFLIELNAPLNLNAYPRRHKGFVNKISLLRYISFRAESYQSIIMLMGSQQLYTHLRVKSKVNHLLNDSEGPQWTNETASKVLEAWKCEFTKVRRDKNSVSCKYFETCVGLIAIKLVVQIQAPTGECWGQGPCVVLLVGHWLGWGYNIPSRRGGVSPFNATQTH